MSLRRSRAGRVHHLTWALVAAALAGLAWAELPETKRVNSVKSLTHILSQVEEANGDAARFTTMKLQIHLEDVYISQGTAIILRPADLARAIGELLAAGNKRSETARIVLQRYHDGEFHE